jgi:hypothetical protein
VVECRSKTISSLNTSKKQCSSSNNASRVVVTTFLMIDQVAMSLSHHPEVAVALFLHPVADVVAEEEDNKTKKDCHFKQSFFD